MERQVPAEQTLGEPQIMSEGFEIEENIIHFPRNKIRISNP
jgi:hypothetical protein